jgi:hypothetical protein
MNLPGAIRKAKKIRPSWLFPVVFLALTNRKDVSAIVPALASWPSAREPAADSTAPRP